jgi:hypothetical protein
MPALNDQQQDALQEYPQENKTAADEKLSKASRCYSCVTRIR